MKVEDVIIQNYWKIYINAIKKLWEDLEYYKIEWIVNIPKWDKQDCDYFFDYEYVDQSCWICWDDFYWDIYYPLNDWNFIKVNYSC